jgi:hypothetical protein
LAQRYPLSGNSYFWHTARHPLKDHHAKTVTPVRKIFQAAGQDVLVLFSALMR